MGGPKQQSDWGVFTCELIRSGSEQPLTLQSASQATLGPKYCEAAERRNTQCKTQKYKVSAHGTKQTSAK